MLLGALLLLMSLFTNGDVMPGLEPTTFTIQDFQVGTLVTRWGSVLFILGMLLTGMGYATDVMAFMRGMPTYLFGDS